jgi:hypothetical protein
MRLKFKTEFLEKLCGRTHKLAYSLKKPASSISGSWVAHDKRTLC